MCGCKFKFPPLKHFPCSSQVAFKVALQNEQRSFPAPLFIWLTRNDSQLTIDCHCSEHFSRIPCPLTCTLQHCQRVPARVALHRCKSDSLLPAQREEAPMLPAAGPGERHTNHLTPPTELTPCSFCCCCCRCVNTAAIATPRNISGRTRRLFWPPTTPRMASTTSSFHCVLTSVRRPH